MSREIQKIEKNYSEVKVKRLERLTYIKLLKIYDKAIEKVRLIIKRAERRGKLSKQNEKRIKDIINQMYENIEKLTFSSIKESWNIGNAKNDNIIDLYLKSMEKKVISKEEKG